MTTTCLIAGESVAPPHIPGVPVGIGHTSCLQPAETTPLASDKEDYTTGVRPVANGRCTSC